MKKLNHKPLGAALALAVAAQGGLAGNALAATHKSTKKKKSKSTRRVYKVKCATVNVRCQGTTGARGHAGANGKNGTNGANGHNGALIVQRARVAEVPLVTTIAGDQFPRMTGNHWVQGPSEDDQLQGAVTFTIPAQCNATGNNGLAPGAQLFVETLLDGQSIGYDIIIPRLAGGQTETDSLAFGRIGSRNGDVPSSGFSQDHVLSTRVSESCGDPGDNHFVIKSLGVDVSAFS